MKNLNHRIVGLFSVGLFLAVMAIPSLAQVANPGDPNERLWTPFAAGTISDANGSVRGSWYAYETSGNPYGFFLRGYSATQNKLWTINPYETIADGRVQYWYLEYQYDNHADPEDTHYWTELGAGRLLMGPGIGIPGTGWTIMTTQVIGWTRVDVVDQWKAITFTLTVGNMNVRPGPNPQPNPRPRPDPGRDDTDDDDTTEGPEDDDTTGWSDDDDTTDWTEDDDTTGGTAAEGIFIYAVNTSGWSLYVGRPSDVEGRAASSFADGGTGNQPVEYKKLVATPFASQDEAIAYLKSNVSFGHDSVWTGRWVKFQGGEYRTVHVYGIGQ